MSELVEFHYSIYRQHSKSSVTRRENEMLSSAYLELLSQQAGILNVERGIEVIKASHTFGLRIVTVLVVATGLLPHVDHVLHIPGFPCWFEQGVSRNQSRCHGFRAGDGQRMRRYQLLHLIGVDGGLGLDVVLGPE